MNKEQTHCLKCGKPVVGRSDKKFCDAYCRNSYNNQVKSADQQYILDVNGKLRRNRTILKSLCPSGKATVRRDVLEQLGYDYKYFTGTYSSPQQTYYLCYDFGFTPIVDHGKQKVLIIQKQNYMDNYTLHLWK